MFFVWVFLSLLLSPLNRSIWKAGEVGIEHGNSLCEIVTERFEEIVGETKMIQRRATCLRSCGRAFLL